MTLLVRASEIIGRPVVTLAGEDVAEVRDVAYGSTGGELLGFTLNQRGGLFRGPRSEVLLWSDVHGLGRDAVVIADEGRLRPPDDLAAEAHGSGGPRGDVLGSRVLTTDGTSLGEVTEVIIDVRSEHADVVGYEIEASEVLRSNRQRVLIPLPDTLAVSTENLIVPASAVDFVRDDLSGFGAAVDEFRDRLRRSRS